MIKMMMRRGVAKIIALYWHPRYLYSGSNPSKRDNQGWHCVSHKPKKLSGRNELKLGSGGSRKGSFDSNSGVNDLWSGLFRQPFNMINMIEYFHHEIFVSFVDNYGSVLLISPLSSSIFTWMWQDVAKIVTKVFWELIKSIHLGCGLVSNSFLKGLWTNFENRFLLSNAFMFCWQRHM